MNDWKEVFRKFYDDNEAGGSSRWLVAPTTVEAIMEGQIANAKKEGVKEIVPRIRGKIMFHELSKGMISKDTVDDLIDQALIEYLNEDQP